MPAAPPIDVIGTLDEVEAILGDDCPFAALQADRVSLLNLVHQMRAHKEALESPLRVLLVGGTGVGKSTCLNAIAGAEIARASDRRPTTDRLTAYHHRSASTASLGGLEKTATLCAHERASLYDKILIDAPDFDSTVRANRETLVDALGIADLVLCLVSPEKYLSRDLFRLLYAHREGLSFVFVLNKTDRLNDEAANEIRSDLARELSAAGHVEPRVLALSARAALEGSDAGEFPTLLAILEEELDRVRIREIKTSNLLERLKSIQDRVSRAVPADMEGRLLALREDLERSLAAMGQEIGNRVAASLAGNGGLREALDALLPVMIGGVFGFFLGALSGLRALLQPGRVRLRDVSMAEVESLLRDGIDLEPDRVDERATLVRRRFVHAGGRAGLREAVLEQSLGPQPAAVAGGLHLELCRRVRQATTEIARGASGFWSLVFNAPPLVFAGYVAWRYVADYMRGTFLGTDFLAHSAVLLLLILAGVHLVSAPYRRRRTNTALDFILEVVRAQTAETLKDQVGEAPFAALARLENDLRRIRRLASRG